MFFQDPYRTHSHLGAPLTGFNGVAPCYSPLGYGLPYGQAVSPMGLQPGMGMQSMEINMLRERLDQIQLQLAQLTDLLCRTTSISSGRGISTTGAGPGTTGGLSSQLPYPGNPYLHQAPGYEMAQGARLRESDSLIFWEIFLPRLSMNDVDVEVSGNRVICRTRVPLFPQDRFWNFSAMPRGFEVFELPDGRAEFNWTVPVSFEAKEVEATWKEGFICICIPKAELASRHSIQVTKDSASSRKGSSERQTHAS